MAYFGFKSGIKEENTGVDFIQPPSGALPEMRLSYSQSRFNANLEEIIAV
jgi:hypothetical protein